MRMFKSDADKRKEIDEYSKLSIEELEAEVEKRHNAKKAPPELPELPKNPNKEDSEEPQVVTRLIFANQELQILNDKIDYLISKVVKD